MMTGLLNRFRSGKASASLTGPLPLGATLRPFSIGLPPKTPMLLTASSRRISLVASSPFMTGSWMSISTRWNPPVLHMVTASLPFMADFQRTFSLFIKASSNFRLMTLSSTSKTLIGGTELSSSMAGLGLEDRVGSPLVERATLAFFFFFGFWPGCGEPTRLGGVRLEGWSFGWAGGVGRGGAEGTGPASWDLVSEKRSVRPPGRKRENGSTRPTDDLAFGLDGVHDGRTARVLSAVHRSTPVSPGAVGTRTRQGR